MNAQETLTAAIQKLEAIRLTPPTVWTIGPYAPATQLMRRTVEPQIVILRQALQELEPFSGWISDYAVPLELDHLAREILRTDGWGDE